MWHDRFFSLTARGFMTTISATASIVAFEKAEVSIQELRKRFGTEQEVQSKIEHTHFWQRSQHSKDFASDVGFSQQEFRSFVYFLIFWFVTACKSMLTIVQVSCQFHKKTHPRPAPQDLRKREQEVRELRPEWREDQWNIVVQPKMLSRFFFSLQSSRTITVLFVCLLTPNLADKWSQSWQSRAGCDSLQG